MRPASHVCSEPLLRLMCRVGGRSCAADFEGCRRCHCSPLLFATASLPSPLALPLPSPVSPSCVERGSAPEHLRSAPLFARCTPSPRPGLGSFIRFRGHFTNPRKDSEVLIIAARGNVFGTSEGGGCANRCDGATLDRDRQKAPSELEILAGR